MNLRGRRLGLSLQVLLAVAAGVALGHWRPAFGEQMKPLGEGFVRLVRMLIAPLVFLTVVVGIARAGDAKKVGRIGLKALVYFEVLTTVALGLGLLVVRWIRPGVGLNIDPTTLDSHALPGAAMAPTHGVGVAGFLLHVIPDNVVDAFARGEMLQVLFFAVLFGFAVAAMGEAGAALTAAMERIEHALFGVVRIVMYVAPLGAFGAMAFTVGKYGVSSLASLAKLVGAFYLTGLLFVVGVLGPIVHFFVGLRFRSLVRYLKEELLIVLGTSSSESALPRLIEKLEALGCSKSVVGLVVPTGYSFNLDGTCIYLTMAALFVAQATNVTLSLREELGLLALLLLTSKGAAAVTGGGFLTLTATLTATGKIPVAGLTLLLGVDRFLSEARALVNFLGNSVATLVVAKWENELDLDQARRVLTPGAPKESKPR